MFEKEILDKFYKQISFNWVVLYGANGSESSHVDGIVHNIYSGLHILVTTGGLRNSYIQHSYLTFSTIRSNRLRFRIRNIWIRYFTTGVTD